MPHFTFRRHTATLTTCFLFITMILAFATFAALPAQTHAASAGQGNSPLVISNRCGPAPTPLEGPQTLVTLNKGQTIKGSAIVTGDDETHEEEALSIYADGQPFIQLFQANTGRHDFHYTAKTD